MHVGEMTAAERSLLLRGVLERFPHLGELVPPRLLAVIGEPHPLSPD